MTFKKQLLGSAVVTLAGALALTASVAASSPKPQSEVQVEPSAPAAPVTPAAPGEPGTPAPAPRAYAMAWSSDEKGSSYLGVDIRDITSDRVSALKLKDEHGVEIVMVDQDAPAGKAGLKEHDVVLEFNGARVESEESLRRMIRETPAGRNVTLGISRDGQPQAITVTLGSRKDLKWKMAMPRMAPMTPMPPMPPMESFDIEVPAISIRSYSMVTGVVLEGLTPQLREFFGVKGDNGVLVRSVEKGSAAEAAGFKAGDVIVKAAGESIGERSDWSRVIRAKTGKIAVVVVREKKETTLNLDVPQRRKPKDDSFLWKTDNDWENALELWDESDHDFDFEIEGGPDDHDMVQMNRMKHIENALQRVAPRVQAATALAQEKAAKALACANENIAYQLRGAQEKIARAMAANQERMERNMVRSREQMERGAVRMREQMERNRGQLEREMQRVREISRYDRMI